MDDGDILRPRAKPIIAEPEFELKPDEPKKDYYRTIDLMSLSKSDTKRFWLSRRVTLPSHITRRKLEEFFDDVEQETVVVLSMMAKCFVAKIIERARSSSCLGSISVSEILEAGRPPRRLRGIM